MLDFLFDSPQLATANQMPRLFLTSYVFPLCRSSLAHRPSCVAEEDLLQINLWLGAMETTTNMHYDANHNLLFVVKGRKQVTLLPPNMMGKVQAIPVCA